MAGSLYSRSKQTSKMLQRRLYEKKREKRQAAADFQVANSGKKAEYNDSVSLGIEDENIYMLDIYDQLVHSTLKTNANSIKSLKYERSGKNRER